MTTYEERLNELLGMAQNLGYMEAQAVAAEHRADMAPRGSTAQPRREARELRKLCEQKAEHLSKTRERFVAYYKDELEYKPVNS